LDGGLISTSANLTGQPAPRSLTQLDSRIAAGVDYVIDGGELQGQPSCVLDLCCSPPRLRRTGAHSLEEIKRVIGSVILD